MSNGDTLAILVGGGPAPGINGVIASATIEAINSGLNVIGLFDGYRHIALGDATQFTPLSIEDVSRIHVRGGSILRTSRTNPAKDPATLLRCVEALDTLGVRYLMCIGGDDTTYGATQIAAATNGRIGVVAVPKTIDNDLPLPDNAPTFGFETARSVGTGIVENLLEDARTTVRWYLCVSMGRTSGSLALGICKAAGATLGIIPEEFERTSASLDTVADTIVGAIVKRRANGHDYGVAVIAEGVGEFLSAADLAALRDVPRDAFGHVRLAEVPIANVLRESVHTRLEALGIDLTVVAKDIGYELRCAKPVPFDVEYTRTLGYGAVRYLLRGGSGALVALSGGRVRPLLLDELRDPQTGRVRIRTIDVHTEGYEVARSYMIRLEPSDLMEPQLARLAAQTNLTPEAFRTRFAPVASRIPSPPEA
jgi:6-phosphofructokinase 1